MKTSLRSQVDAARTASTILAYAPVDKKHEALSNIAARLLKSANEILIANKEDLREAQANETDASVLDRIRLTPERIAGLSNALDAIASLPDPVGEIIEARKLPNKLNISKVRVPLGVVACIYENRPNVTVDIAALCLKSGNASVLRGGKEAIHSNTKLAEILRESVELADLPGDIIQFIGDTDRALVGELL